MPNLVTIRPADATETVEAWKVALERHGPTALILTRQAVPVLDRRELAPASGVRKGGYVLWKPVERPDVIVIGTGSEVQLALEGGRMLQERSISSWVVSMPSWELFDAQPEGYRNTVLPPTIRARVSIEALSPLGWEHYVGLDGAGIGVDRFGASAPYKVVMENYGITAQRVADEATRVLERLRRRE